MWYHWVILVVVSVGVLRYMYQFLTMKFSSWFSRLTYLIGFGIGYYALDWAWSQRNY